VEVGLGRRSASSIPDLIVSADRTRAGRTAPPQGLCLEEVFYDLPRKYRSVASTFGEEAVDPLVAPEGGQEDEDA
jgi:tRNA pseudouridine38-40 synthase